jgi:hypothetical protein
MKDSAGERSAPGSAHIVVACIGAVNPLYWANETIGRNPGMPSTRARRVPVCRGNSLNDAKEGLIDFLFRLPARAGTAPLARRSVVAWFEI